MEEKNTVKLKKEEYALREAVKKMIGKGKVSNVKIEYTPVGEKIIILTSKPGLVIGKQGSILDEIKKETLWTPQIQRSPAIKSQITENIREVLYANNNYRRRFLNKTGEKIYAGWNPEKVNERLRFFGRIS